MTEARAAYTFAAPHPPGATKSGEIAMRRREIRPEDERDFRPRDNSMSYLDMGITRQKWARTGVSWWVNILVMLFLVLLCVGLNIACLGVYIGWDNLWYALGWSK
jgi:hypothetical protein